MHYHIFRPIGGGGDSLAFLYQNTVAGTQRIGLVRRFVKAPKYMFKSLPRHMLWIIKMELSHLLSTQNNIKTDGQENILTITLELFANLDL